MRRAYSSSLLTLALWAGVTYGAFNDCNRTADGDVYQFNLTEIDEVTHLPLEAYRGKVLVVFNSATYCGFNYQYATMNVLVEEFNQTHPGQVDFVAIPTNNFGLQEPGANDEILSGLEHVRPGGGFKPLYKVAAKNECNGVNADPLFVWLKAACLAPQGLLGDPGSFYFTPIANDDITWNFEKFLVDQAGKPVRRYTPDAYPLAQMREDILELLANPPAAAVQEPAEQPVQEQVAPAKAIDEELLEELVNPLEQLNDVMKHMGHKKRQPGKFHRGL